MMMIIFLNIKGKAAWSPGQDYSPGHDATLLGDTDSTIWSYFPYIRVFFV